MFFSTDMQNGNRFLNMGSKGRKISDEVMKLLLTEVNSTVYTHAL